MEPEEEVKKPMTEEQIEREIIRFCKIEEVEVDTLLLSKLNIGTKADMYYDLLNHRRGRLIQQKFNIEADLKSIDNKMDELNGLT